MSRSPWRTSTQALAFYRDVLGLEQRADWSSGLDDRLRTAELDEARVFLEGVLASVAAGVVVRDAELLVRSWNKGAEELWGLRADATATARREVPDD